MKQATCVLFVFSCVCVCLCACSKLLKTCFLHLQVQNQNVQREIRIPEFPPPDDQKISKPYYIQSLPVCKHEELDGWSLVGYHRTWGTTWTEIMFGGSGAGIKPFKFNPVKILSVCMTSDKTVPTMDDNGFGLRQRGPCRLKVLTNVTGACRQWSMSVQAIEV